MDEPALDNTAHATQREWDGGVTSDAGPSSSQHDAAVDSENVSFEGGSPLSDAGFEADASVAPHEPSTPIEAGAAADASPEAGPSDCPGTVSSEASSANILLTEHHADVLSFALGCNGRRLLISTRMDLAVGNGLTSQHVPESVLVYGGADFLVTLPDERFEAIAPVGSQVWLFPEYQLQPLVWPGWQSYDITPQSLRDDSFQVHLEGIDGPGTFAAFFSPQDELSPPTYVLNPAEGLFSTVMGASSHSHMNWAFTEPGLYRLTFSASAVLDDGTPVSSAKHTLRFFVGDLAELPASEPTLLRVEGTIVSSTPGEAARLVAVRYGAASDLPVTWLRSKSIATETGTYVLSDWEVVASGDTLEVGSNQDSYQFKASLFDGHDEVATSQPVHPYIPE